MTINRDFTREWARHCPRCGAGGFVSLDGRHHHCATCELDYYHNLAAAVAAVIRCGQELALIVRGREPGRGLLDLPGGFVDPGESLETAIEREVREELGVSLTKPVYLLSHANTYRYRDVTYCTTDAFFEFHVTEKFAEQKSDEVQQLVWQNPANLRAHEIAFDSVRYTLRRLGMP